MRLLKVISKSLKEQIRSFWLLLLSLSMGPFFISVYFLIIVSSEPEFAVLVINNDTGTFVQGRKVNHGDKIMDYIKIFRADTIDVPFTVQEATDKNRSLDNLRNKKADALIIIDASFSQTIEDQRSNDSTSIPTVEFFGNLTDVNYLISAVWANEILTEYVLLATGNKRVVKIKETALGTSATASNFDIIVPGILMVSLIMLMFTASIAFVSEVENKTILRLKLSKLTSFEFLAGISIVQLMVGILSVVLTLITAKLLGFQYKGSLTIMIMIASLTSLSIIAFSLIIAAITKSASEVLVVGNFPMFLFMFFTGAAFPIKSDALFTVAGYPINIQGFMTPTHAISALNKTLIMDMDPIAVIPEIVMILLLTFLYFFIGGLLFKKRHLKLK